MSVSFYDSSAAALPHPPVSLAVLLVLERAIRAGWDILISNAHLQNSVENTVTHELKKCLVNKVYATGLVSGFDDQLFTTITRDSKVETFDGSNVEKMPDMLVGLVGRGSVQVRDQDFIFIECKPVDREHPAGSDYCDKGLARFVYGEYAWAMSSALMVGYARPGYRVIPKLDEALRQRTASLPTTIYSQPCHHSEGTGLSDRTFRTEHPRTFVYSQSGKPAGPIEIRHLWLFIGERIKDDETANSSE